MQYKNGKWNDKLTTRLWREKRQKLQPESRDTDATFDVVLVSGLELLIESTETVSLILTLLVTLGELVPPSTEEATWLECVGKLLLTTSIKGTCELEAAIVDFSKSFNSLVCGNFDEVESLKGTCEFDIVSLCSLFVSVDKLEDIVEDCRPESDTLWSTKVSLFWEMDKSNLSTLSTP